MSNEPAIAPHRALPAGADRFSSMPGTVLLRARVVEEAVSGRLLLDFGSFLAKPRSPASFCPGDRFLFQVRHTGKDGGVLEAVPSVPGRQGNAGAKLLLEILPDNSGKRLKSSVDHSGTRSPTPSATSENDGTSAVSIKAFRTPAPGPTGRWCLFVPNGWDRQDTRKDRGTGHREASGGKPSVPGSPAGELPRGSGGSEASGRWSAFADAIGSAVRDTPCLVVMDDPDQRKRFPHEGACGFEMSLFVLLDRLGGIEIRVARNREGRVRIGFSVENKWVEDLLKGHSAELLSHFSSPESVAISVRLDADRIKARAAETAQALELDLTV